MEKIIYNYKADAIKAAVESGKEFYQSTADESSRMDESNDWAFGAWSGEVQAFRSLDGDIWAWWAEESTYFVNDSESGNAMIYCGESLADAIDAVRESHNMDRENGDEIVPMDIMQDGERIYCDLIDTESDLDALLNQ